MAITINGTANTVAGVAAGGINDNVVDNGTMADDAIGVAELSATGTASSSTYLRGDNSWAAIAGGLTVADQWRVTSSWTGNAIPVANNWERVDNQSQGKIGTAMTESSGVFSFPETGVYFVTFGFTGNDADTQSDYIGAQMNVSVGGGGFGAVNVSYSNTHGEGVAYGQVYIQSLIDVTVAQGGTNPTKVNFEAFSSNSSFSYQGGSSNNHTYATFLRLGDT